VVVIQLNYHENLEVLVVYMVVGGDGVLQKLLGINGEINTA